VFTPAQAARVKHLQAAYRKAQASSPRDDAPNAGQIRSLGLLDASDEQKNIKKAPLIPTKAGNI